MTRVPVFVSAPKSFLQRQENFIDEVEKALCDQDLRPMTLGRSEYDMDAPLVAIRKLMAVSCGLLCIAFRRTLVEKGVDRPGSDRGEPQTRRDNVWLTSPYAQIEPSMAYQIGLPILLWRESGVVDDGVFDRGAIGQSMPTFDLDEPPNLADEEWRSPLSSWVRKAHSVYARRGSPPKQWCE